MATTVCAACACAAAAAGGGFRMLLIYYTLYLFATQLPAQGQSKVALEALAAGFQVCNAIADGPKGREKGRQGNPFLVRALYQTSCSQLPPLICVRSTEFNVIVVVANIVYTCLPQVPPPCPALPYTLIPLYPIYIEHQMQNSPCSPRRNARRSENRRPCLHRRDTAR